ncbi:MAG: M23 family metallopeptidase [Myxococcota bacterium]|nr:M23 family metallopeptidase [Myxococcota bacterium]
MLRVLVAASCLIACGDAPAPTSEPNQPRIIEPAERVGDVGDVRELREPREVGPRLHASDERSALPAVARWLPEARRCGRFGARRYCNGPRRAPEPEGASAELAAQLGLGTHRAAAELIRATPRPEWIAAVRGLVAAPRFPMTWPVDEGRFGRGVQRRGRKIVHRGVDVTAEVGTPVRAVAAALVGYADNTVDGYGNLLVLVHGGGEVSAYAHLDAIHVHAGQLVDEGQLVARAGNTGLSRGPHLHFEWREDGELADPMRRFEEAHVPAWMRPLLFAAR